MDPNLDGEPDTQQAQQNTHKLNAIPSGKDPKRNYWKAEEEQLLKDWADKAQCYEWMHLRSHIKYKSRNAWFTIPVIIISTITGTANFAQDRFSDAYKSWVVMGVGAFNIFAGIITTIYQFLKISELSEGHRVSALYWGKFYRNLRTELSKHPLDRSNHESVITNAKEEYDRLLEMSPMVAQTVIKEFNKKYGSMSGFTRPEIVTTRFGTDIYTITDTERKAMVEDLLADKIAIEKAKEAELARALLTVSDMAQQLDELRAQLLDAERAKDIATMQEQEIKETLANAEKRVPVKQDPEDPALIKFKDTFFNINGRVPTDYEVKSMFKSMFESPSPSHGKEDSNRSLFNLSFPDLESGIIYNNTNTNNTQTNNTRTTNLSTANSLNTRLANPFVPISLAGSSAGKKESVRQVLAEQKAGVGLEFNVNGTSSISMAMEQNPGVVLELSVDGTTSL